MVRPARLHRTIFGEDSSRHKAKKQTYETHPVSAKPTNKFIPCRTCSGENDDPTYKIPGEFELLLADATWLIRTQSNRMHILQGFFGVQTHKLTYVPPNKCRETKRRRDRGGKRN